MPDTRPQVPPEVVGQDRREAAVRDQTDRSGRTVLGFGATTVAIFGVVVLLFVVFLVVILTNLA